MKYTSFSLLSLLIINFAFAQDVPKEITPQLLQKITAEVEKSVPALREKLSKQLLPANEIEFSIDTFRINRITAKRLDIDYSTAGMVNTIDDLATSYDKVMNKYYNKLLRALKPQDKKVLINAQRSWLAYRNAEAKLISMMTKDAYSGGGSIQSNIEATGYADIVQKRAITIFGYYTNMITSK